MNNENTSSLEVSILSTFLYKSFLLIGGINILLKINKADIIISSIVGFLLGAIILFLFTKIGKILPEYNIFEKIDHLFSKNISRIIKILLLIPVLIFCSYSLYSLSLFVQFALLSNVDILPISILIMSSVYYVSKKGINTLTKTSLICFLIFIILEAISIMFSLTNVNSLKILPLFESNLQQTLYSSFIYIILIISPLFLLLIIPKAKINHNEKLTKYIKIFYIISGLYIFFNFILVLSIIDSKLLLLVNYPELFILSKISLLNFFDRMENILVFKLIFDSFFLISLSIIYISTGVFTLIKRKFFYKYTQIIIMLIVLLISNLFNIEFLLIPSLIIFILVNVFILLFYKLC